MIEGSRLTTAGHSVSATPPTVTGGLADMLVSLGEARIGVTGAERDTTIPGAYVVTVTGEIDKAVGVLVGQGFTVHATAA
jgi:hypothetical protein